MKKRVFGQVGGRKVEEIGLESADAAINLINYGATLRDWRVDGPNGSLPMVLGFGSAEAYADHAKAHGTVVGRVANRTAGAEFELDGKTYALTRNDGRNHLHGVLQHRIWEMDGDASAEAVHLRYVSPDGEDGFPGRVEFQVTYRLEGPVLVCEMRGVPDRPTPVNLAHHGYYNLGGGGTVRDHVLWADAPDYTPLDGEQIPDGTIRSVEGTRFDFREARALEDADPDREGYDQNLVLSPGRDRDKPAARVSCERTGRVLTLWTDQPGLQVFDAATMTIVATGHDGAHYGPFAGLCLEAQHFPDSLHNPDWPSIIATPEAPYFQRLAVEIGRG